ncbi:MAG: hypothetical protein AB7N76_25265 [Planctomycetota bacterium]
MSAERVLLSLVPPGLDPALWRAVLDLCEARRHVRRGWELSVSWEETEAPFSQVADFFREEQTVFPRLPLGNMDWALDAEERCARRYHLGERRAEPLDEDEDLRAPWLTIYLVTSTADPTRALVGTVRRGVSARTDAAIGRALAPIEAVPGFGELALSLAEGVVDRERSAILWREREAWQVEERIRC